MRTARSCAAALALALSFAAGCTTALPRDPTPDTHQEIAPAVFLARAPYPGLLVEVDWVEGQAPSAAALEGLRAALLEVCDKPDGARVVLDDEIPEREWNPYWNERHWQESLTIADRWCSLEPRPGEARLYILYVPDALLGERGAAYSSDTVPAIVIGTRSIASGQEDEETELIHESGHLLGLVGADAHETGRHCTDPECVMTRRTKAKRFCADCRGDLDRARTQPLADEVTFVPRGVLRRSRGGGYIVSVRFRSAKYRLEPTAGQTPTFFDTALEDPSMFVRGLAAGQAVGEASRSAEGMHRLARAVVRERSEYVNDALLPAVAFALRLAHEGHDAGKLDEAGFAAVVAELAAPDVTARLEELRASGTDTTRTAAAVILGDLEVR